MRLGLSDTSASLWAKGNDRECGNQGYFRCSYGLEKLYWNQDCSDNSKDMEDYDNLCVSGTCKKN